MNIFGGIPHNGHYETIRKAVIALVERARSRSLLEKVPWSLAELALDQEDYTWLCNWASALSPAIAQRCLMYGQWSRFETAIGECSNVTGIGILLLLFSVEIARRQASERVLWSVVSQNHFAEETRKVLFAQNHPNRLLKDAIELAARWLKLRHVFGIEGLQNWYDTVYLQLGFTHAWFNSRLPEWLVGSYPTFAMQQLLNDGPMQSKSFYALWQALGLYRRNQITDVQVRRGLQANPWILPEWIPELLQQARARPHLRVINAPGEAISSSEASLEEEETFLSAPELFWDTFGDPSFTCQCLTEALFALTEPTYHILVGGSTGGRLQRSADGTYQAHPAKVPLPLKALSVASIVAMDGSVIQSQTVQLWDQNEDVSAFSSSGVIFDSWNRGMMTGKRYYLLLAADLEIRPLPTYWYHINTQTTLYVLEPDWSAQTQVLLEGKLLWQPQLSLTPRPSPTLKSQAIQVRLYEPLRPLEFQEPFRLAIEHPEQYELLYISLAGQALDFEHHTSRKAVTEAVSLQPQMFALKTLAGIDLRLGFQHRETGAIERVPYRLELPVTGVTILEQDGWRVLERDRPLNIAQIQWKPLRFYVQDIPSWSVFEGTTWIDTAWQRPKQLRACAGFGAPLKLQKSIYNNNALQPALWIADQVIDTGCVGNVVVHEEMTGVGRCLEVGLLRPIEPDTLHRIVWWDQEGTYCLLQPEQHEIGVEGASWFVPLPADCTQPVAVGIAYDGEWLGSWFCERWTDVYSTISESQVRQLAILSRWFHLPLLDKELFDYGARFARDYADEVLPIWLIQEMLPQVRMAAPGLRFTDGDEGWLTVVRSIYFDWQPTDTIDRLIMNISDPPGEDTLPEVAQKLVGLLGRINPILMARVIKTWIEQVCLPQWGAPSCSVLIRSLFFELAEVTNSQGFEQRKLRLLQELAGVMNVDPAFIEKSLIDKGLHFFRGQKMDVNTRRNIAIAMHVEPFRRLLSMHLLEHLNGEIAKKRSPK